jgi:hypothetical protein
MLILAIGNHLFFKKRRKLTCFFPFCLFCSKDNKYSPKQITQIDILNLNETGTILFTFILILIQIKAHYLLHYESRERANDARTVTKFRDFVSIFRKDDKKKYLETCFQELEEHFEFQSDFKTKMHLKMTYEEMMGKNKYTLINQLFDLFDIKDCPYIM